MRTRSHLILLWVSLMLTTITAACDVVGPPDLCIDWTDAGGCKTKADSVAYPLPAALLTWEGRQ